MYGDCSINTPSVISEQHRVSVQYNPRPSICVDGRLLKNELSASNPFIFIVSYAV